MSEKYYVAGCRITDEAIELCEDSEATFWTLYERDAEGLSQGVIDCVFREDAVAAMAVYVERDRLNEQVRALAAQSDLKSKQNKFLAVENDRLQTLIYKNILPYRQQGFIPGDIDDLIAATKRHMEEINREIGARAIESLKEHPAIGLLALGSELDKHAAAIRAGEVPNA